MAMRWRAKERIGTLSPCNRKRSPEMHDLASERQERILEFIRSINVLYHTYTS